MEILLQTSLYTLIPGFLRHIVEKQKIYWSDTGFNCTVVNWALSSLHWGLHQITRTVPLKKMLCRVTHKGWYFRDDWTEISLNIAKYC